MCSVGRGESVISIPDCCMHQIKELGLPKKKIEKEKKERKKPQFTIGGYSFEIKMRHLEKRSKDITWPFTPNSNPHLLMLLFLHHIIYRLLLIPS
jgi:hypothetical protein